MNPGASDHSPTADRTPIAPGASTGHTPTAGAAGATDRSIDPQNDSPHDIPVTCPHDPQCASLAQCRIVPQFDTHPFHVQAGCNLCVCGHTADHPSHQTATPRWACVHCGWEWPSRFQPPPLDAECDSCGDELEMT